MLGPLHIVIVGSYAPADEAGIHAIGVDTSNGRLVRLAGWPGVAQPSFLVVTPDRTAVHAVSEIGASSHGRPGRVHSFALDTDEPELLLSAVDDQPSEGDAPCHLSIDRSGRWLAVANYGSGTFALMPVSPGGGLGGAVDTVRRDGSGPDPGRQTEPHAHGTAFTPDGRHLAMADLGADRVAIYAFDPSSGSIEHRSDTEVAPGAGPRHVWFSPDGRLLVVANELDSTVSTHRFDPSTGETTAVDTRSTLGPGDPASDDPASDDPAPDDPAPNDPAPDDPAPDDPAPDDPAPDSPASDDPAPDSQARDNLVAAIRMSPAGDRLYVSNRGHDSIAVLGLAGDGRLDEAETFSCGGHWPRDIALLPDGRHLLVANERSNHLALLPLSADGSSIGPAIARLEIPSPTCVAPIR